MINVYGKDNIMFKLWVKSTEGATAIEYGLIAAGISLGIIAAVFLLGDGLEALLENLPTLLDNAE